MRIDKWLCAARFFKTGSPAEQARKLYEESAAGRAEREKRMDQRRWGTEPALQLKGRPTKRDRRLMEKFADAEADPAEDG